MIYRMLNTVTGLGLALSLVSASVFAQAPDAAAPLTESTPAIQTEPVCSEPQCPIASRGAATVTVADLGAKLASLERKQRDALLSDPRALNGVVENLLITRQIALEADRASVANDPIVAARLKQAEDEVYAVVRLDDIRRTRISSNFERLAREHYQANKASYIQPRQYSVRHILINTVKRTERQAFEEAIKMRSELQGATQDKFAQMAVDRSDDPTAKQVGGILNIAEGDQNYDPGFMQGMTKLTTVGEISQPVKSHLQIAGA